MPDLFHITSCFAFMYFYEVYFNLIVPCEPLSNKITFVLAFHIPGYPMLSSNYIFPYANASPSGNLYLWSMLDCQCPEWITTLTFNSLTMQENNCWYYFKFICHTGNRKSNALHFYYFSFFFLAVNLIKIRQDMLDVPKEH